MRLSNVVEFQQNMPNDTLDIDESIQVIFADQHF